MRLAIIGYPQNWETQGQIQVHDSLLKRHDIHMFNNKDLIKYAGRNNLIACVPGANFVLGISGIFIGIFCNPSELGIHPDDYFEFRVLKIVTGFAELTLVGGWIIHGVATLYFHSPRFQVFCRSLCQQNYSPIP